MKKTAVQVYIQAVRVNQVNPEVAVVAAQAEVHQVAAPVSQKPHSTGDLSIQTIIQVNPPAELGLN